MFSTRALLATSAILEGAVGVALLLRPSIVTSLLLGSAAESTVAVVLGRLAGAALTALGTACWFARDQTGAARGLMASMLLYNIIAAGLLTFVAVVEGLQSPLTWPVVLLHVAMMVWCVLGLRRAGGS
jgi:hypothetical protein